MITNIFSDMKLFYKTILLFALFTAFILLLVEPFIISNIHLDKKITAIACFTLSFIITMLFQAVLFPNFFIPKLNYSNWSLYKHIIYNSWLLFMSGFISFIFISSFYVDRGIPFLLEIAANVIFIYSIPQFFFTLLLSRQLNNLESIVVLKTNYDASYTHSSPINDKNRLLTEKLVFIKAEDNYASFHYSVGEKITRKLERISMSQLEQQIHNSQFIRCHRSYIINLNFVEKVERNLTGFKVILKGINNIIPVSRKNNKLLKKFVVSNSPQI